MKPIPFDYSKISIGFTFIPSLIFVKNNICIICQISISKYLSSSQLCFMLFFLSFVFCRKFYLQVNEGMGYLLGHNGTRVRTTIDINNADIFEIEYRKDSESFQVVRVRTQNNIALDIAGNKTDLHYWNTDVPDQQFFHVINLPDEKIGVVSGDGRCLEYNKDADYFYRTKCDFTKNVQIFNMVYVDEANGLKKMGLNDDLLGEKLRQLKYNNLARSLSLPNALSNQAQDSKSSMSYSRRVTTSSANPSSYSSRRTYSTTF
ncbi:hypothetical protein SLOPH_1766 [Spraguea lophii 42_110]|uniref:Ricin B lectin domain-containing protein n=1 Tax=Spraguea lophii (strain 42_110) TaxID=1358809 RepID=S7W9A1_SPRLO|nr:hypothetical protein SLOPH_1766 [Spraguea lophii 42_110]